MNCEKFLKSKILVLVVIGAFLFLLYPEEAWTQTAGLGAIKGFIYREDMKTALENAVVVLQNIEDASEMRSAPTDKDGAYVISNILDGSYLIGVSTQTANYNFDYVIAIKADETAELSLAIQNDDSLAVAGLLRATQKTEPMGRVVRRGVFSTSAGKLLLIAASGFLTYGIIKIATTTEPTSPAKKKK